MAGARAGNSELRLLTSMAWGSCFRGVTIRVRFDRRALGTDTAEAEGGAVVGALRFVGHGPRRQCSPLFFFAVAAAGLRIYVAPPRLTPSRRMARNGGCSSYLLVVVVGTKLPLSTIVPPASVLARLKQPWVKGSHHPNRTWELQNSLMYPVFPPFLADEEVGALEVKATTSRKAPRKSSATEDARGCCLGCAVSKI